MLNENLNHQVYVRKPRTGQPYFSFIIEFILISFTLFYFKLIWNLDNIYIVH